MSLEGSYLARVFYECERAEIFKAALKENNIKLPEIKPLKKFLEDFGIVKEENNEKITKDL